MGHPGVPPPPPHNVTCLSVGPEPCTVERSLYGYRPNLGANGFFAAVFGLCLIAHLLLGVRYKTWTYMIALSLGCLGEMLGYIGRIMLYNNVYDKLGFQIQICCLIICPAFLTGGIYLTLKHIVINFGERWSRLRPSWYTYIFISGDIFSLVLQGAGGGIAATADPGTKMLNVGTDLMIAGVIFQVVILVIFGYFLSEYAFRTQKHRDELTPEALKLFHTTSFRLFFGAIMTAYFAIFIRCIYRIPELVGGWRNPIMRNQPEFIVLEGAMVVLAALVMTIFHPGFCFPALANTFTAKSKSISEGSASEMARA